MALVRKSLAWITGIILLVSTLIGVSITTPHIPSCIKLETHLLLYNCLTTLLDICRRWKQYYFGLAAQTLNFCAIYAGLLAYEHATYQGHPPVLECQD